MDDIRLPVNEEIGIRKEWIEGWNALMVDIWAERLFKLGVRDTDALYKSLRAFDVKPDADGRFLNLNLSHSFLEYGIWQDLGTGWGYKLGNGGNLDFLDDSYRREHGLDKPRKRGPKWGGGYTSGNKREPQRWESPSYYRSAMKLRDFMSDSLGREFKAMICNALDADKLRQHTDYYKNKGYTR